MKQLAPTDRTTPGSGQNAPDDNAREALFLKGILFDRRSLFGCSLPRNTRLRRDECTDRGKRVFLGRIVKKKASAFSGHSTFDSL